MVTGPQNMEKHSVSHKSRKSKPRVQAGFKQSSQNKEKRKHQVNQSQIADEPARKRHKRAAEAFTAEVAIGSNCSKGNKTASSPVQVKTTTAFPKRTELFSANWQRLKSLVRLGCINGQKCPSGDL